MDASNSAQFLIWWLIGAPLVLAIVDFARTGKAR
jgi:hypothetical protein